MIEKIEDAVAVIRDFEKIIRSRKRNIVCLPSNKVWCLVSSKRKRNSSR